jgi:hypothetical protein
MEEDNAYPNDGTWIGGVPIEPPEQAVERKKERAQALEAASLIEVLLSHFDERIKYRDSLSSISVSLAEDPLLYQKVCEVNKLLKIALEEERGLLEELLVVNKR